MAANDDTLTVVGGVFDRVGKYVFGTQKLVELKFKDQTLDSLPEGGITVKTNLDVASGNYIVRLVVRDSEGKVMSALNSSVVILAARPICLEPRVSARASVNVSGSQAGLRDPSP